MKDKNLLDDIKDKSLNELTKLVDNLVEKLEKEKIWRTLLQNIKN